jgi:hypothetical protein
MAVVAFSELPLGESPEERSFKEVFASSSELLRLELLPDADAGGVADRVHEKNGSTEWDRGRFCFVSCFRISRLVSPSDPVLSVLPLPLLVGGTERRDSLTVGCGAT